MDDYNKLSIKNLTVKFVKISSIYGFFIFLTRFGAFFITPIYWHFLTPKDYGIIGVTSVLPGVLSPIILFGLHGAVQRYYYEWAEVERARKIGALWLISIIVAIFFVALIEITSSRLFPILFKQVSYNPYFRIVLWTTFFSSFHYFPFNILRITEKAKIFGLTSLISFMTNAGISITLLILMDVKVLAMLLGSLFNSVIWAGFWIAWMLRRSALTLRLHQIKQEIYYALPSLPNNILNTIGQNYDRYILEKYVGLSSLGFYSIGKRFGDYYNAVNQSLKTAWFPMTYKMIGQRKDMKQILPFMSLNYFFILTIFALAASLLSKEIIFWFGKTKFEGAYQYVPIFVLYYLIQNFGTAWGRGADLIKKPVYELISIGSSVLIGIGLLYLLVPRYGTYGAITALISSYSARTIISVWIAHILYPRKFMLKEICCLCFLLFLSFYGGYQVDFLSIWGCFALKGAVVLLYMGSGLFVTFGYQRMFRQIHQFRLRLVAQKTLIP